jgi:transcriptional regulator with XRE-family HTH domain
METTVKQRLIEIRNYYKIEQEDMAVAIGVSQSAISQFESANKISYKSAKKISDTYKTNMEWVMNGVGKSGLEGEKLIDHELENLRREFQEAKDIIYRLTKENEELKKKKGI